MHSRMIQLVFIILVIDIIFVVLFLDITIL